MNADNPMLEAARRDFERAQAEVDKYRSILEWVESQAKMVKKQADRLGVLPLVTPPGPDTSGNELARMAIKILKENGEPMKTAAIVKELLAKGARTSKPVLFRNLVFSALDRTDGIEKDGPGLWKLKG